MLNPNKRPDDIEAVEPVEHVKPTSRAITWLVVAALVATAVVIGILLRWSFQSTEVLHVHEQPFPVRTIRDHPTANGVVFVKLDYCKLQDIEGSLRLSFVSESREILVPITRERSTKGCHNTEFPIRIPDDATPGTYTVNFKVTYDVNPLKQQVSQTFTSKEIIVDPI